MGTLENELNESALRMRLNSLVNQTDYTDINLDDVCNRAAGLVQRRHRRSVLAVTTFAALFVAIAVGAIFVGGFGSDETTAARPAPAPAANQPGCPNIFPFKELQQPSQQLAALPEKPVRTTLCVYVHGQTTLDVSNIINDEAGASFAHQLNVTPSIDCATTDTSHFTRVLMRFRLADGSVDDVTATAGSTCIWLADGNGLKAVRTVDFPGMPQPK